MHILIYVALAIWTAVSIGYMVSQIGYEEDTARWWEWPLAIPALAICGIIALINWILRSIMGDED